MVASLPPNIQLKLQQTLLQWKHWHCDPPLPIPPRVISQFDSGLSNFSILVEAGQRFVVRIDGAHAAGNALCRNTEWRALSTAHQQGIAPCPRYYNPELGVLVCDFLPADTSQSSSPADIAKLLRKIHALPHLHHRMDVRDRMHNYERQLNHRGQTPPEQLHTCREYIWGIAEQLGRAKEPLCVCHNDLLAANRIVSKGVLHAIDWEYSAMGSPWFDLAGVLVGDDFDARQAQALVNAYLQRSATAQESLKLTHYCLLYQYLELLWYLFNQPTNEDLESRITALQDSYQNSLQL